MRIISFLGEMADSPLAILLVKWTALLGLAWLAHGLVRNRHGRWRVILWRSVLAIGLLLPLLSFFQVPLWKVRIDTNLSEAPASFPAISPVAEHATQPVAAPITTADATSVEPRLARAEAVSRTLWRRPNILLLLWGAGALAAAIRLCGLHYGLSRLRKRAQPLGSIETLVAQLKTELGVQRRVELRQSDNVNSPFVTGVFRPMIILPTAIAAESSAARLRAVIRHELAHLRNNDLPWSIAWRWVTAIFWFHPLAWKVPAAHNLACEEEADRVAAGEPAERAQYVQMLAQVALRAVVLPPIETSLTLNGASQIVRRLNHLRSGTLATWKRSDSVAAFALAAFLMLLSAGWELSTLKAADAPEPEPREWKEALVIVTDEEDNPLAGATIEPYSFRVKGVDSASAHSWQNIAVRRRHKTDSKGKVSLRYPVMGYPEEKELTGKISFIAAHPDYATQKVEISVDDAQSAVKLVRGISLEVSGYYGRDRQPVYDLVANLSGDPSPQWTEVRKGVLKCGQLTAGEYMLQLMGKLPSGQIVHSEGQPVTAKKGETRKVVLELKPGIRLEGRIDNKVPRPVKNGRVIISVRPKEFPALPVVQDYYKAQDRYGYFNFWSSYRPISDDGSFAFESVPPGEVDVIVHGDGFISRDGPKMQHRIDGELVEGPPFGYPQAFALHAPVTKIEVATQPAVTLRVTTNTRDHKPIEGAKIYVNPNVMRIQTGIFGSLPKPVAEEAFQDIDILPEIDYSAVTDEDGVAVLRNVPVFLTMLDIEHPEFEVPLGSRHDRTVRFKLAPGEDRHLEVVLQPKGQEFIGEIKHQPAVKQPD